MTDPNKPRSEPPPSFSEPPPGDPFLSRGLPRRARRRWRWAVHGLRRWPRTFRQARDFLLHLVEDPLIPARDKALLLLLIGLLASPLDLIPDFIPVLGALDDVLVVLLALDYVFQVLPESVVAAHFPFGRVRLRRWRKAFARWGRWIPDFLRRWIWKAARTAQSDGEGTATG